MNYAYAWGALLRSSSATRLLLRRFEAESIINLDSYPKGSKETKETKDKKKDNFPKLGNLARYLPHTPNHWQHPNRLKR